MTGNVRQTPPEPTCGTLWVTSDNSPTFDGTGPQNAPEGTVDMNSIDNLRDYVLTAPSICSTTRAILVGYIDNIEREVAELRDREYRNGMEDGEMAAERDGWVRLPVDADGMPIHVGDVMENIVCPSVHREVTGVGVECFYGWDDGNGRYSQFDVVCYRHHHAPTVEDVLREFAYGLGVPVANSYVAATAAKLRLVGDE